MFQCSAFSSYVHFFEHTKSKAKIKEIDQNIKYKEVFYSNYNLAPQI